MSIKCIIVEDEPKAIDILCLFIEKVEGIECIKTFREPLKALEYLKEEPIDFIFSDINMPDIDGLQFVSLLNRPIPVIFTTAYPEYAVKSYEFEAVDYLLKPIALSRFIQAIDKVKARLSKQKINESVPVEKTILLKSGSKLHQVAISEIQYLEKDGHYITFHLEQQPQVLCRMTTQEVLDLLPEKQFIQIHKSFIVAFNHLHTIESHQVVINGVQLPVGKVYREQFIQWIENRK